MRWTWAAAAWLSACGAAGDLALLPAAPVAPVLFAGVATRAEAPVDPPPTARLEAAAVVATGALDLDGTLRVAEPLESRGRREASAYIEPLIMPLAERAYPRIASKARGSISIGTVTGGFLVNGAELPYEGRHHRVLQKVAERHTRFATDEMRDLLLCAAEKVGKAHPGHKMHLGNLARQGGGLVPWSVSHHNGRDADVAFYARDRHGRIAQPEHLYHFNRRLQATDAPAPTEFDVPANWTLVKALVTGCPGPSLQRLFIAGWLREPLLQYAKKQKEDKEIIAKVAGILAQPRRALAHNDHLHLRIGCAPDDETEGCLDASRAPAEAVGRAPGVQHRLPAIRTALKSVEPQTRAGALYLLGLYRDAGSSSAVLRALSDDEPAVRKAAVQTLLDLRPDGGALALSKALDQEHHPEVMATGLQALVQLDALDLVARRFADERNLQAPIGSLAVPDVNVRRLAVELLSESASLAVARAAVPLLADADLGVREAARYTLGRIVHRTTFDIALELALPLPASLLAETAVPAVAPPSELMSSETGGVAEAALWQRFFDSLPVGIDRDTVALSGMQRQGLAVQVLGREALPELVRALSLGGPARDSAARFIERIVQFRPVIGRGARSQPASFWGTWLVQKRYLLALPAMAATSAASGASAPLAAEPD